MTRDLAGGLLRPEASADSLKIQLRLTCYVREEDSEWLAGCPSLDVHTQADSKEESCEALREAVQLWLESCLERETLPAAMRELGWHRCDGPPESGNFVGVSTVAAGATAESVLGESFPIELSVPAFLAAALGADRPDSAPR